MSELLTHFTFSMCLQHPLHILCTMAIATHNKTLALRFVVPTVPYTFWYDNTFLYELGSNLPLIQFFTALLCILHYNLITLTPLCGNDESAACKRQFVYYLACAVAVFMLKNVLIHPSTIFPH